MGATLLKEAARKKLFKKLAMEQQTATVLAHSILTEAYKNIDKDNIRNIKNGITNAVDKVVKYLEAKAIEVKGSMLDDVATISCNNDLELGKIIGDAFKAAGENGVVIMEPTTEDKTEFELVDGVQYEKGFNQLSLCYK